jgi:Lar family restriction alleviation protein
MGFLMADMGLKPCPFCNSKKLELIHESDYCFWVVCDGCGVSTGYCEYKKEAIEAWNRREG